MNYYAIVNGINSICALVIAVIIFFHRTRKAVHLTYAFFYLLIFFWAFFYFIWGIQTELHKAMPWLQALLYPVSYVHVAYLHFALLFSETIKKYRKWLVGSYALSTVFALVNGRYGWFDMSYIRNKSPFLYWPHATPWLNAFIVFQVITVLFSFLILYRTIQKAEEPLKIRLKAFFTL